MPDWLTQVLTSAAVTGASIWLLKAYAINRIKNDFERKLEELRQEHRLALEERKPLTAEETLRRETYLNSKLEAYLGILGVIFKRMASRQWRVPKGAEPQYNRDAGPTEEEFNKAAAKISLFCKDPEIHHKYLELFRRPTPQAIGELIALLRKDIGYGDCPVPVEQYVYYYKDQEGQSE